MEAHDQSIRNILHMVKADFHDESDEESYTHEESESGNYYDPEIEDSETHSHSYTQSCSEGDSRRFVFPENSEDEQDSESYIYSPEILQIPHSALSLHLPSSNRPYTETKSKSTENTSYRTVIQHETPKTHQILNMRIPGSISNRPESTKTDSKSTRSRGRSTREYDSIHHESCSGIIKSIHNNLLVKQTDSSPIELGSQDQEELENYLHKKIQDFQNASLIQPGRKGLTPLQVSKRNRLKDQNKRKARRSEDILRRMQQEEIQRKQKASEIFQNNCNFKLQRNLNRVLDKYHKTKVIEDYKHFKEISEVKNKEKELIKANIQNRYDSRIHLLKEQVQLERYIHKLTSYDRKKTLAEAGRKRQQIRKKHLEDAMKSLDSQRKEFLLSLQEAEKFEEKIIKLYKKAR